MEKDIGKIKKGEFQGTVTEIVVGIREYNGRVGIDIREFATSDKYTGPTKKGLRIPAENFEDFKKMINSIKPEDLEPSVTGDSEDSEEKPKKTTSKKSADQEELPDY